MHSVLLNPSHLFMGLTLTVLCVVGVIAAIELFWTIFPVSVTSVSDRVLEGCYRFVLLAALVFCVIAILHLLIGGGTNAH